MSSSSTRILSPEEIALGAGEQTPFLRYPERSTVFGEREMRLRQLAAGHAMGDFLAFIAELAHAQGEELAGPIAVALPSDAQIDSASRAGLPLLAATNWQRDGRWIELLRGVLSRTAARLSDNPARRAVVALAAMPDAYLEHQADRLLGGVMLGLDLGAAPLVAAGLQVYFTHLVLATRDAHLEARLAPFGRIDDETICPCCASRPVAGIVRIGAAEAGFRYLACALCSTQWHMVRIKCSHCLSTKGISYQSLRAPGEGEPATGNVEGAASVARAVQAECCAECGHYLKIVHMERDPNVEPAADDLATVTLDLLVSDSGLVRHGINPMLLFGDPDAPPDPGGG